MTSDSSRSKKSGLPPGSLIHVGRQKADKAEVSMIEYDHDTFLKQNNVAVGETRNALNAKSVCWVNVDGLHDVKVIGEIGEIFQLHALLLEDVLNTAHRPKAEEFSNCLFVTFKMLGINSQGNMAVEQVSLVLGESWVVSFQEMKGDVFDTLRNSLENNTGLARGKKADFLLYRLLDTIVDGYFHVVDDFRERIDKLEIQLMSSSETGAELKIQRLKKELIRMQRAVAPLREAISTIGACSSGQMSEETKRYLNDVQEHIVHVLEYIANAKESINDLRELYISNQNNRLNEVMKVLTIMSTIFIPMTFIAGIYGMNFQHMPELTWHYGYYGALGLMVIIPVIMLIYFKRRDWI